MNIPVTDGFQENVNDAVEFVQDRVCHNTHTYIHTCTGFTINSSN